MTTPAPAPGALRALQARKRAALLNDAATRKKAKVLPQAAVTQAAVAEEPATALEITDHLDVPLRRHPNYENGRLYAVIGEPMRLRVRTSDPQARLDQISWTVDDHALGQCVQTNVLGTAVPLSPADRSAADISFFWITGGEMNVQVTARVDDQQATATALVEVLAPTVQRCRYTTSTVNVFENGGYLGHPGRWMALYEGPPDERFGCSWDARVSAPFKQFGNRRLGAGMVGFIQVSGFTIARWNWGAQDQPPKVTHSARSDQGATALDAEAGGMLYGDAKAVMAGAVVMFRPNEITYSDSPGCVVMAPLIRLTRSDLHQTHLVYKSDTAGSIWVTLRRGEWRWEAKISRLDTSRQTSGFANPTDVTVVPHSRQQTDAQVSHDQPTWTERTDAIIDRESED